MSQDRQSQFDAIQALIKRGEFDKARMSLEIMGGAKAARWIAELNERHPPIKTAPQVIKPKRAPISEASPDDMEDIKVAIREKRYDDAEALLILSDHPDAEKLRTRLEAIHGGGGAKTKTIYVKDAPDFNNKLVLCIVLLFLTYIPGLIALEIFASEAKQHPNAPGAQGILITRKVVWFLTILMLFMLCMCGGLVHQVSLFAARLQLTLQANPRRR